MSSVASSNKTPRGLKPALVPSDPDAPETTVIRNKQPSVETVTDRLKTPSPTHRFWRVIRLSNQLEALLVHDAETDKASAALDVNVGSFSDEDDMPGMAQAVEHLLFMGTKKYPTENAYNQYLPAHSGYSNAYTGGTSTDHSFELVAKSPDDGELNEDSSPLYGDLDRELKAVASENKKNLQSDEWRRNPLSKSLSSPKHLYSPNTQLREPRPHELRTLKKHSEYLEENDERVFNDIFLKANDSRTPLKCSSDMLKSCFTFHQVDAYDTEMARLTQRNHRRGRGARRNSAYWKKRNNEIDTDPFDGRELLFEDGHGSLKASRMANLDTQLKISKHKGDDLVMSSHCAKELGLLSRISSDFEDPCLRSISGHSTAVKGILRDVQFRLKGGSVTFRRDFWVSDSINDIVDVMIGANFIKDHFKLLFERVKECVSTFATWFSKKRETPEQKAEREERERQQQIQILENETKRLREESEMYKQSGRANDGSQQGGSQRAPLAGRS